MRLNDFHKDITSNGKKANSTIVLALAGVAFLLKWDERIVSGLFSRSIELVHEVEKGGCFLQF